MAVYKVQYESNGRYWDFTMTSSTPLSKDDPDVISAAIRDSARTYAGGKGTVTMSVRIIMVTEDK
ncbi:hypothetical protein SSARUM2_002147 [Serratia sp. K-E0102]|uniref:hypothetical protein n=1 Tax=Serratia TaxID=613 RepID=UPI000744E6CC|nr:MULTISPECIES: hypothetical protein [Serratia]WGZ69729.1 hypothetical protein SSARUM2_002147 [Serratia sp. K-E0102]CUZ48400.1 Uncharacterised protein [Serratia marcescens]